MIICGVDLETTGLSSETDTVTEIGAILWDTDLNEPVKFFNKLIKIDRPVPAEITKLTGITDALLQTHGEDPKDVWQAFKEFQLLADGFMAHNAPFDKGFIEKQCGFKLKSDLWIDSVVDVSYPESIKIRSLKYLAAEHNILNFFPHRAISDVQTMFLVVSRYNWAETIANGRTPNVTLKAMVSYDQNQKAKAAGFYWDAAKKIWFKQVKQNKVPQEKDRCFELGFVTKEVG
jgi:DNA polymerase III subunit epsilon